MDKAYTISDGQTTYAVDMPMVEQTGDATIQPNVYNIWGAVTSLTITKGQDKVGIVNNYIARFVAGADCSIQFVGFELQWIGGLAPIWEEGKIYEISIVENFASFINS